MQHCVGGYDLSCSSGQSHIFSVRDENGNRISTLELSKVYTRRRKTTLKYVVRQNRGFQNNQVSNACGRAVNAFLRVVNQT